LLFVVYIQLFYLIVCRDAAALAQFWDWLETEITNDRISTEVEVSDKLLEFRSKQAGFLDTSFDTISGTVVH
jgi:Xaa-Pro aminopeptidase